MVSWEFGGSVETYGRYGVSQLNDGGVRLIDWATGKRKRLINTCFQKIISHLATYKSGHAVTVADYTPVNCCYRSRVNGIKEISGKEVASQYHILIMEFLLKREIRHKKKFRSMIKLWKLKNNGVRSTFQENVEVLCNKNGWTDMILVQVIDSSSDTVKVCGYSKGEFKAFRNFVEVLSRKTFLKVEKEWWWRRIKGSTLRLKKLQWGM